MTLKGKKRNKVCRKTQINRSLLISRRIETRAHSFFCFWYYLVLLLEIEIAWINIRNLESYLYLSFECCSINWDNGENIAASALISPSQIYMFTRRLQIAGNEWLSFSKCWYLGKWEPGITSYGWHRLEEGWKHCWRYTISYFTALQSPRESEDILRKIK